MESAQRNVPPLHKAKKRHRILRNQSINSLVPKETHGTTTKTTEAFLTIVISFLYSNCKGKKKMHTS